VDGVQQNELGKLAPRPDARAAFGPRELAQAVSERRRLRARGRGLQYRRTTLAIPLGRRAV